MPERPEKDQKVAVKISENTKRLAALSRSYSSSSGEISEKKAAATAPTLAAKNQQVREMSTTARTMSTLEISNAMKEVKEQDKAAADSLHTLKARFTATMEVAVSKIFPAGFGWQSSSILADKAGFADDSLNFALTTGAGDFAGVFLGHNLYYAVKGALGFETPETRETAETGLMLASAAFCSGAGWQPIVNTLQGFEMSFGGVFTGTFIGCGTLFYAGLRASRTLLSETCKYIEEPTYENSKDDASLSISIGSATAFFVGTDAAYLPAQNFLINVVGIPEGTGDLAGCAIAGSSTALGFTTCQTGMNLAYPKDKCWID